jgi:hypothetical protein
MPRRTRSGPWADRPRRDRRLTWRGLAVSLAVAALFLAFAAGSSLLAPVHVLTLEREAGPRVRADLTQRLLLVIPIRRRTVLDVREVASKTHSQPAYAAPSRRPPDVGPVTVHPEEEGALVLSGTQGSIDVSTSPAMLDDSRRRVADFLAGSESHLRLWLVSNWKAGVLLTVLVALPGVLIVLAVLWDIGQAALRFARDRQSGTVPVR